MVTSQSIGIYLLTVAQLIHAAYSIGTHVFRESAIQFSSDDVLKEDRVSQNQIHEVIIAVKQNNIDTLSVLLDDISNPMSANYGQHMTRQEIAYLTASPDSRDEIVRYLKTTGASIVAETLYGEFITARAPVHLWEKIFSTEFYTYSVRHAKKNGKKTKTGSQKETEETKYSKKRYIRADSYSVPISLDAHVAFVLNTIQMPPLQSQKLPPISQNTHNAHTQSSQNMNTQKMNTHTSGERIGGRGGIRGRALSALSYMDMTNVITPQVLSTAYNIGSNAHHPLATQAVFESLSQTYSSDDLKTFENRFYLPDIPVDLSVGGYSNTSLYCCNNPGMCAEGNLDIQYLTAVSGGPTTYIYTEFTFFSVWLTEIADMDSPPLVLSISYGIDEMYVSQSEFDAFSVQAIKLSAMGVTLLAAAGDDGAGSWSVRMDTSNCGYMPYFPASSPYVTAVGGTQGIESSSSEVVCQSDKQGTITSGGGFSTYYPTPSWQSTAVTSYFALVEGTSNDPYPGYNAGGRGYPDISAASLSYSIIIGGDTYYASGTSASTPVVAGMISLVNAARIKGGGSAVGWINPTLYGNYQLFTNDITSGSNYCSASFYDPNCCVQGYTATVGWDPTSGLGSLNFKLFKDFMLNLPGGRAYSFSAENDDYVPSGAPTSTPGMPSSVPTMQPSGTPTIQPAASPTTTPTEAPTSTPTLTPTSTPSLTPTLAPTITPSLAPTTTPTLTPTITPSLAPTTTPTLTPTITPSLAPTTTPTLTPTITPSLAPTTTPTLTPTVTPSLGPTTTPTLSPTLTPTITPSLAPTTTPTLTPTVTPSLAPTTTPTLTPTVTPSLAPTTTPTLTPTVTPSLGPTTKPTLSPTITPSLAPTTTPTLTPTITPSLAPTTTPTLTPTVTPSLGPTTTPTLSPTLTPTITPSLGPTTKPTHTPTVTPSLAPTTTPTLTPTVTPSLAPTTTPTLTPTVTPSLGPTTKPTLSPTITPSLAPTTTPTLTPTITPSLAPTTTPTLSPTITPSLAPTTKPTLTPTITPSLGPTTMPTFVPTSFPTITPTMRPTYKPSLAPSTKPSTTPTFAPSATPSSKTTYTPSNKPTLTPTKTPSSVPSPAPSNKLSVTPTKTPSLAPSNKPTLTPTKTPSTAPTSPPTSMPSFKPSVKPS